MSRLSKSLFSFIQALEMHTVVLGMHILEGIIKNIVVYDIKKPIKFFFKKKKLNPEHQGIYPEVLVTTSL